MRSFGRVWELIVSLRNLEAAMRLAARGKRFRTPVAKFLDHADDALRRLRLELMEGRYQPRPFTQFYSKYLSLCYILTKPHACPFVTLVLSAR